jgi:hypothetical protein
LYQPLDLSLEIEVKTRLLGNLHPQLLQKKRSSDVSLRPQSGQIRLLIVFILPFTLNFETKLKLDYDYLLAGLSSKAFLDKLIFPRSTSKTFTRTLSPAFR